MSNVFVRNPSRGEVERAAEIAKAAFPELTLEHWQRSFCDIADWAGERFILVVEADGQLVSSMLCTPGPIYIGDNVVPHSAVGAVGTLPEHRNKGYAGAMMTECVKLLREERLYTSSLWPFSFEYYRKFGWEFASEIRAYTADAGVFVKLGDANCTRGAVPDDLEMISSIYNDFAQNYNCCTQRQGDWWRYGLDIAKDYLPDRWLQLADKPESYGCLVNVSDGEIDGYGVYRISEDRETKKLSLNFQEIIYKNSQARINILARAAKLMPEASITFSAPADDTFRHEISDPEAVKCTLDPTLMFRVIDPTSAMLCLQAEENVSGKLSFKIGDPVFADGFLFGLDIDNGGISLCAFDDAAAIEMDVQTMAKLYSGSLSPFDAFSLGKIKVNGDAIPVLSLASAVFSPLTPYRSWLEPG